MPPAGLTGCAPVRATAIRPLRSHLFPQRLPIAQAVSFTL
jgi:hypothetical protein